MRLLVMTEEYAGILSRTQAKPGGLEDHHDDYGAGATLFPCGVVYALLAAV